MNKTKWKEAWQKAVQYSLLYALLPLLSGAILGGLFWINAIGVQGAESMFRSLGEQSVFAAVGKKPEPGKFSSFYFLSSEGIPPLPQSATASVGSARYTFTLTHREQEEEIVPPVKTPERVFDALPAGAEPIIKVDLSTPAFFINTTKYTVDVGAVRNTAFPSSVQIPEESPLVLVLHTHGTEGYFEDNTNLSDFAPEGVEGYILKDSTSFRTTDPQKSVVQVGKVFSDTLNELGIPTVHVTVMHDKEDFNSAYQNSAKTVAEYLSRYPSIQYVVDLHRDSVVRGSSYVKTFTKIEERDCAQVMLVVGTNQNGNHPNWKQNLVVATAFKDSMDTLYPSLSRALYLRTSRFNQNPLPGCMLLEVGSAANTLEEAENAALYAARSFSQMIRTRQ